MKIRLLTTICIIVSSMIVAAQVPSLINYQGRLTDANGDPVTGSKNFSLSIHDAATGGNLLYTETIGAVTLDSNGVYNFQFGSAGTSNTQVTETVGTADGTSMMFQKILSNTPVVAGSVSVTDGTYTWSQSSGSSSDDDFGAVFSTSLSRVTVNYYTSPPGAGEEIVATYSFQTGGISGALSSGAEHWIEVSIDAVTQGARQRVLAVPYSLSAGISNSAEFAKVALSAPSAESLASQAQELSEIALFSAEKAKAGIATAHTSGSWVEFLTDQNGFYDSISANGLFLEGSDQIAARVYYHTLPSTGSSAQETITSNSPLRYIRLRTTSTSGSQYSPSASISGTITYADGSTQPYSLSQGYGYYSNGQGNTQYVKPNTPDKALQSVTIRGTKTTAITVEATVWINEPRSVEFNLPSGFVSSGVKIKPIASFKQIDQSSSFAVIIVDSSDNEQPLDLVNWTTFTGDDSGNIALRVTYYPGNSDSEVTHTKPEGILLLKQ